ncbi:polysaccharide biosynthesis/export family protein [Acidithiobacillus ferridurans]|uniref:polysaccharide biosynthesis/export family protein n=1 Tax=Acidithiobacillus ferridurans TaxID=1232575 RepID=UPI00384A7BF6
MRLWSYSGLNLSSANGSGLIATNLSPVTVDPQGRIDLPYLPSLRVAGDTPAIAAQAIARAYAKRQTMEAPQAQVRVAHQAQGVWIYGAGNRHFLPWTPHGWTLAQALSGVSGGNSSGSGWASSAMHHSTSVHVVAHGRMLASLPIAQALRKHIPLVPQESDWWRLAEHRCESAFWDRECASRTYTVLMETYRSVRSWPRPAA